MLIDVDIIFQCILELFAIRFVDCGRRRTRNELTATFEKMPRTAKNRQKPKANERRPLNYTLQHAIHETRYTEANASNNTGSAVLAPHGALGYHHTRLLSSLEHTSVDRGCKHGAHSQVQQDNTPPLSCRST